MIAFDLGTTFSGVSYSIMDPGETPDIRGVTRFPAHEQINSGSKIPSVLYYDKDGNVQAVGAQAMQPKTIKQAKKEGWKKAEWFKLRIRPKHSNSAEDATIDKIPPLPFDLNPVDIASDFFKYLFDCTRDYIKESHANGEDLWRSIENDIDFVISHPNGWGGYQQSQLREAVQKAKLTVDGQAPKVSFITEGEASLHFALRNGLPAAVMEKGDGVIIVDAGGGTIDVSAYRKPKFSSTFEEIAPAECHFLGSVFVTLHARIHLNEYLKESDHHEDLDHIVRCFDKTTKVWFNDDQKPQYVRFGSVRDNDSAFNIRFGQLKLEGSDVASFFEPSVKCVTDAVKEVCKDVQYPVSHVVLVGGFSASEWLYKQLKAAIEPLNLEILRPQVHPNKAVSDGAVSSFLNGLVTARIARFSYGVLRNIEYDPNDNLHVARGDNILYRPSGRKMVPDAFEVMLEKGTKVSDDIEVAIRMWKEVTDETTYKLESVTFTLYCYKGSKIEGKAKPPRFYDQDEAGFSKLCSVQADLSKLPLEPLPKANGVEGTFYRIKYYVVLLFNSAELKAHIRWDQNGVEQRTAASVMFFDDS